MGRRQPRRRGANTVGMAVCCVFARGKQLSSQERSRVPLGLSGTLVGMSGELGAQIRSSGAHTGQEVAIWLQSHVKPWATSPGMICSGERRTRPEDQLTKVRQPQSKDSQPRD